MKKVLILLLFIPLVVNAKTIYLYDVLKNEAESGGVAREYTGEHHDSFTVEPSKKIYHWYADTEEEVNQAIDKSFVLFGDYCWQMIRTTDTGGVKMIYAGPNQNGDCNSPNRHVSMTGFNPSYNSIAYVGYMYNPNTLIVTPDNQFPEEGAVFGNNVTYSAGSYTLVNTSSGYDIDRHYTCNSADVTCSTVRYYYNNKGYVELSNGRTIEQAIVDMLSADNVNAVDSNIKAATDSWYSVYMTDYTNKLEDVIYCNDRSIISMGSWDHNSGIGNGDLLFKNNEINTDLRCTNETDKFSVSNNKAKLTYPVGAITVPEINILKNKKFLSTGNVFWTMSPDIYINEYHDSNGFASNLNRTVVNSTYSVRPVISLAPGTKFVSGNGGMYTPYVVRNLYKSNITINNNDSLGTLSNIGNVNNVEELSTVIFNITPIEGYYVDGIDIKDANNNYILYDNEGTEYSFIMPGTDVVITPVYEKVKSNISVQIVNETENINININDMTQVEFGEEVIFNVTPIRGFKIKNVKIMDSLNNEINYIKNNDSYKFTMPGRDVVIVPSYERVSNSVTINEAEGQKEFTIDVNDVTAVVYEDKVRFTVIPDEDYELESITILDRNNNKVDYSKTEKDNEFEFIMPDTNVIVSPVFKRIYKFIEGMGQSFDVVSDSRLRFRVNMDYDDFIREGKVYIDNKLVDSSNYEVSRGSTVIIFNDNYSKSLNYGKHEIVTTLSNGKKATTDFSIDGNTFKNPNTVDKWGIIILIMFISVIIITYLRKRKVFRY